MMYIVVIHILFSTILFPSNAAINQDLCEHRLIIKEVSALIYSEQMHSISSAYKGTSSQYSLDTLVSNSSADSVYMFVDQMPVPVGGTQAVYQRMTYPDSARQAGIEGRIVIEFIVNTRGEVIDPVIILGLGGGLNEVVIEGIKGVPFEPGILRGEAVNVRMQYPILFRLEPSPESIAQQNAEPEEQEVLDMTDSTIKTMPEPIGGIAAIYENVVYPQSARLGGYEGTVIIRFTIDKEGYVVNPEVIRGVGGGLNESAIQALTQTRFTPALRNGEPVAVSITMPINFRLSPSSNSRTRRTRGN